MFSNGSHHKLAGPAAALSVGVSLVLMSALAFGQAGERRPLKVGVYENPPKVFHSEDGQADGLFIDILEAIAAEEGWVLAYVDCTWTDCLEMLRRGELDLMPDVAYTQARANELNFHRTPVLSSFSRFYAPEGHQLRHFADLEGKRVAVLAGSSQAYALGRWRPRLGEKIKVVPTSAYEEAFEAVAAGKADAVVANEFYGGANAAQHDLEPTGVVMQPAELYYAAPKGTQEIELAAIDRHLDRWRAHSPSPYFDALSEWTFELDNERVPKWLMPALYATIGGLLLAGLVILGLRRQIIVRTKRHMHERIDAARALEGSETRTQQLETAGLLAGGIAHDLNNLLTVINSSSQMALEDTDEDAPIREDLELICEAGQKAAAVTRQLVAFTKQHSIEPQLISMSQTVRQFRRLLEQFIEDGVKLRFNLTTDDDHVFVDPIQLEQVVLNLVINARDAVGEGGTIWLSTYVAPEADQVILQVIDDGEGIDDETQRHVFEPFFTTKKERGGTGLGLATIAGIVSQAKGEVDIASEPGEGTTMTVRMPRVHPSDADSEVAPPS